MQVLLPGPEQAMLHPQRRVGLLQVLPLRLRLLWLLLRRERRRVSSTVANARRLSGPGNKFYKKSSKKDF